MHKIAIPLEMYDKLQRFVNYIVYRPNYEIGAILRDGTTKSNVAIIVNFLTNDKQANQSLFVI